MDGVLETLLQYMMWGGMSQLVERSTEKDTCNTDAGSALCNTIVDGVLETLLQYMMRGGMSQLVERSTEKDTRDTDAGSSPR